MLLALIDVGGVSAAGDRPFAQHHNGDGKAGTLALNEKGGRPYW
jgi:hypothetical protein